MFSSAAATYTQGSVLPSNCDRNSAEAAVSKKHGRAAHEERVADHQQRGAAFAGVDPEEGEQPAHAGLLRRRARTPASGTS
jgi:hypothetical protein